MMDSSVAIEATTSQRRFVMEQSNFPTSENLLRRLVADALGEIERLGYSKRSGNSSSNFPARRNWGITFPQIWQRAFYRSLASGTSTRLGRAMAGVGMRDSP